MTAGRLLGGRYRLGPQLGGGGTAIVHRAEDELEGHAVAVKLLRPQFASLGAACRRFLRESEIAGRLDHPGVVRVLASGEEPDGDGAQPYLVMELVEGETLRALLGRLGPLGGGLARRIVMRLCDVLSHAHSRGVIHRDLKPENVFVTGQPAPNLDSLAADDGLVDRIKLADFGQARVTALASLTGASLTWGTPEYQAPEAFTRGRLDPRSDLYSLGVLLHELITGRHPWGRTQALARLGTAIQETRPPALPPTGAQKGVDALISELVAPRPEQRPESAQDVLARLADPDGRQPEPAGRCFGCQATLPRRMPICLACGQQVMRFGHTLGGTWRLMLHSLSDDAAATGKLLDLLEALGEAQAIYPRGKRSLRRDPKEPLLFLTEGAHHYSKEEKERAITLPTVLFQDLDESTARGLERLFQSQDLDVEAVTGKHTGRGARLSRQQLVQHGVPGVAGVGITVAVFARVADNWLIPTAVIFGMTGLFAGSLRLWHQRRLRQERARFRLHGRLVAVPAADALLAEATSALSRVRVPEARALFAEVSASLYRLAAHSEASVQRGLDPGIARRVLESAPALGRRLAELASRLDEVDGALAEGSEGELLQALGRLERKVAAAAGSAESAERLDLEATRRRLEGALARRQALDEERDRLSTTLCQLLAKLRESCRNAEAMASAAATEEGRLLEDAMAELDAFLDLPLPAPAGRAPG